MIHFLLEAILLGLTLALFFGFGPAFITLVQTSIHRGFKSAAFFATGVMLNDAVMISLCVLTSFQVVMDNDREMFYFGLGAGIILILLGVFTFIRDVKETDTRIVKETNAIIKEKNNAPRWYTFVGKGFVLNILNPFVWIFWGGTVAFTAGKMDGDKVRELMFFSITLATCFFFDLLKALGAYSLKRFSGAGRARTTGLRAVARRCFGRRRTTRGWSTTDR